MTTAEPDWSALKRVVAEALELPADARDSWVEGRCPDPVRRAEVARLLRACERAAACPFFDRPAAWFAEPLLAGGDGPGEDVLRSLRTALAGRYTIQRELGRGGMATVYLAHDERHARPVALKLLHPELVPDSGPARGAARFQREIEVAARLSHPHILPLYDSGATDGLLYYITPYVDGENLHERLRRTGGLPLAESLRVLRDVARALDYAHRAGLVHRDVKPANILLTRDGDALVADFGVAKGLAAAQGGGGLPEADLTEGTLVLGTPAYMAPEQVTGDPGIDHRADLYALGAVAYELLTGQAPFARRPRHEQLAAHVSEAPDPLSVRRPDVPEALAALVDRLLAKSPDARPADAAEVLRLLDAAGTGPAPTRREPRDRGGAGRVVRRSLGLLPLVAALVLLWSSVPMKGTPSSTAGQRSIAVATSAGGAAALSVATPPARGTEDGEAYELYTKGKHLANTRQREGLFRALAYYEGAVGRDPAYARAYAGMADAWTFLGIFGHLPPHEAFPLSRAAAERAIALDSLLVEGHATLAHVLFVYEWDWEAAESALERAIALNPRYPLLRMYYASFLHSVGRPEEALAQLALAGELDPLVLTGLLSGRIYVDTHRTDAAIRVLEETLELDPRLDLAHQLLGHAYLQKGKTEEAIASMGRAAALSGPRDSAQLAYVHAIAGDDEEARRVLARLREGGRRLDLLGFHLAMAYAGLGEADEAFRWLETAYEQHASFMNLLGVTTGFESVRADPRFGDLLRRMGLR